MESASDMHEPCFGADLIFASKHGVTIQTRET